MGQVRLTTILKTDLKGFSERVGLISSEELSRLLDGQRDLTAAIFVRHGGTIVKGEGDSFWARFPSVSHAASAGRDLQKELRLSQSGESDDTRLAVRVAITVGDVLHQDDDIFGDTVNLAARVEGITPADEVYMSQATWLALPRSEFKTSLVGDFELKGFNQPQPIYRLEQAHRTRLLKDQTIVFTDIQGFTRFADRHGVEAVEALLNFWETAAEQEARKRGGRVRQIIGDELFLTFDDASSAIAFHEALGAAWRRFVAEDPERRGELSSAAGVHRGDLYQLRGFLYGQAANVAYACASTASRLSRQGDGPRRRLLVCSGAVVSQLEGEPTAGRLSELPATDHAGDWDPGRMWLIEDDRDRM